MGLLSDPNRRKALTGLLTRLNTPICIVCYLAGIVWFMGLAFEPFTLRTYMSENAMGSTMVEERFSSGERALSLAKEFDAHKRKAGGMPVEWLVKAMQSRGLEVFTQSFSRKLPFPDENKERYMVRGTNVYGILRAPRAPRTEALVITAPCSPGNTNNQAVALLLALAQYFRSKTLYEHILSTHSTVALSRNPPVCINSLLNALSRRRRRLTPPWLHPMKQQLGLQRNDWDTAEGYTHAAQTMMLMVLKQACGRSWGDHGLFLRYHIEAASVRGINSFRHYKTDATTIGRLLEGMVRKLNNLLERLHQSYFFYLLPSLSRFVSIGYYMPAFGLLAVILLLRALDLWVHLGAPALAAVDGVTEAEQPSSPGVLTVLTPVVISHLTGVALYLLPVHLQEMAVEHFPVSETEAVVLTAIAIYTAGLALPHNTQRLLSGEGTEQGWKVLKLTALLYLAVLLGCTALINFSLGFILAVTLVPITASITPHMPKALYALVMVLLSPAFTILYCVFIYQELIEAPVSVSEGWMLFLSVISQGILDHALYGSLVYPLLALFIYPCWLMFWNILFWN
uniref:Glycosylphosphatidylinositol anchor attachment 1 n=1 Tax=Cyprinus carpio TaxID=7962 RepID=A0A8C2PNT3_CYPCA